MAVNRAVRVFPLISGWVNVYKPRGMSSVGTSHARSAAHVLPSAYVLQIVWPLLETLLWLQWHH